MNKKIHLVHSDEYQNWVFDKTHPTQGRRFTNARNLLRAASDRGEFELIEVEPRLATRQEVARVHAQGSWNFQLESVSESHSHSR